MTGSKPAVSISHERVAAVVLELCHKRGLGKTICPSEAARALADADGDWRELMELVRAVGQELSRQGQIDVTQRGRVVDLASVKGPVRFGLPQD